MATAARAETEEWNIRTLGVLTALNILLIDVILLTDKDDFSNIVCFWLPDIDKSHKVLKTT